MLKLSKNRIINKNSSFKMKKKKHQLKKIIANPKQPRPPRAAQQQQPALVPQRLKHPRRRKDAVQNLYKTF